MSLGERSLAALCADVGGVIYRRDSEPRSRRNSLSQFVITTILASVSVRDSAAARLPSGETDIGERELAPGERGNGI